MIGLFVVVAVLAVAVLVVWARSVRRARSGASVPTRRVKHFDEFGRKFPRHPQRRSAS